MSDPRRVPRFTPGGFAFWPAFWMAVGLTGAKAVHWSLPAPNLRRLSEYLTDLWVSAHADVLFACATGLLALAAFRLTARWPRVQQGAYAALVVLGVLCIAYAVASVRIFDYLRSPLTYPLLYLAGDMASMRSSIGNFVDGTILAGLLGGPAAYLLAVALTRRQPVPRFLCSSFAGFSAIAVLGSGVWLARSAIGGKWGDRDDRLIAKSPHWELLASYAVELADRPADRLDVKFGPEDLADFEAESPASAAAVERRRTVGRPRNLILLVLESTGTRYLGLHGSPYPTTPRLDQEAAHALVFDAFYSHVGLTANSMAALTLSIYPYMTWREYTIEYPDYPGTTLADRLRPLGFRTAFIHSGDLAYVGQDRFLQNRGFDALWDAGQLGGGPLLSSWGADDRLLVDGLLRFIDGNRERPFYAMGWTSQTHHPYEPSPGEPLVDFFAGRPLPPDDYDLGRYLNTLRQLDLQIGRLFDGLRARDLADDTLVVLTGDHGEAFGDPHPSWGHGARIWEENVRVPLVLWNPRLFPGAGRSATIGSHVDLNPTIAELMGIAPAAAWQGRSLFDPVRPPRAYFYAARDDYLLGVREQRWKYIYNATRGRDSLYDLSRDPDESRDVAGAHADVCQRLRRRLAAWRDYAGRQLADARRAGG